MTASSVFGTDYNVSNESFNFPGGFDKPIPLSALQSNENDPIKEMLKTKESRVIFTPPSFDFVIDNDLYSESQNIEQNQNQANCSDKMDYAEKCG